MLWKRKGLIWAFSAVMLDMGVFNTDVGNIGNDSVLLDR
jgi:hypothetical protein